MLMEILAHAIGFVIQTAFLLLALWVMIKIQKLDYNFLGLVGTAVLGSGLDMIPYFGHYLAVPALYICIWKVTRGDLFPDAVFTVVVAYALTFCMNLFVIGALMDDLRPSARDSSELETALTEMNEESGTNQLAVTNLENDTESESVAAPKVPVGKNVATNSTKPSAPSSAQKKSTSIKTTGQLKEPSSDAEIARNFSLKGVVKSSGKSMATIYTGTRTYTINIGEALTMQSAKGTIVVQCDEVAQDSVVLSVAGERVELFLQ